MFGYIRIAKPELKIREYETYKSVYCSLCRELGKSYGVFSRFTLSYDFTFLALLNLAVNAQTVGFEKHRCVCNPLKRCRYCTNTEAIKMPAAAAMLMLYYKLKDDLADEKGFKRIITALIFPLFAHAHRKAAKQYPELETILKNYIISQSALEKANCTSLDHAAEPTAMALSGLLQTVSKDPYQKRVLDRMGYCLGRFIYLLDAACDLPRDLKTGSYHVLRYEVSGDPASYAKQRIVPQLYVSLNEAAKAFELLDIQNYKSILDNIIYLGLEQTMKKELQL